MAPKKKTGTALVKWDEELAKLAKDTAQSARVSEGKFISLKGGRMKFNGADIPDNELRCIVVGWVYHNVYYDPNERYDPENLQSPICYAFADTPADDGEMAPLDTVPEKQCDVCAECPWNQWDSAKQGKGKACKNAIRLALIAEDDIEDIEAAEVAYLSVPVTSTKNWLKHVVDVTGKAKRPVWAVVTEIACVPDDSSQFKLTFKNAELIDDSDLFPPLKEKWEEVMEGIDFPYQVQEKPVRKPVKAVKSKPQKFARK